MNKQTFILTVFFALGALIVFGVSAVIRAAASSLPAPVQSSAAATDLAKATQSDKLFPGELAQEAQALAQAKDLAAARTVFKPLSETLIKALNDNNIKSDPYVEAYCPMEQAHWLQTGKTVSNPFGASMAHCGSLVGSKPSTAATSCPMSGGCCN